MRLLPRALIGLALGAFVAYVVELVRPRRRPGPPYAVEPSRREA
jgi:hypothetical protein